MQRARFMIAAAHKSSGKTVVSTGLAAALTARGQLVAPFKKGPDYIDPMWLAEAAGRPAYNLDFNTMSRDEICELFAWKSLAGDLSLVEANKGLFDGVRVDGRDSNAELAKLLATPVILVVDTKGMTRGIAPLLQGYVNFDARVSIAGVILNKTGGARHERKLCEAVGAYTDLDVLGAIRNDAALDISERHLGLITPGETPDMRALVDGLEHRIADQVDLDRVLAIAEGAAAIADVTALANPARPGQGLRIGYARDEAFAFYYPDDLERFTEAGAELVAIDLIRDRALPEIDGLFIGGGFPEERMEALSDNAAMRASVRVALSAGLPCYAECGGLMYLCRSLGWHGRTREMAGFFDGDAVMHERPQGRGYVAFGRLPDHPWGASAGVTRAHEFHYASIENLGDRTFARLLERGHGIDGKLDGLVKARTLAGFVHLRHTAASPWIDDFLRFVAATRTTDADARPETGDALDLRKPRIVPVET